MEYLNFQVLGAEFRVTIGEHVSRPMSAPVEKLRVNSRNV